MSIILKNILNFGQISRQRSVYSSDTRILISLQEGIVNTAFFNLNIYSLLSTFLASYRILTKLVRMSSSQKKPASKPEADDSDWQSQKQTPMDRAKHMLETGLYSDLEFLVGDERQVLKFSKNFSSLKIII